jgi:hypothetical protein
MLFKNPCSLPFLPVPKTKVVPFPSGEERECRFPTLLHEGQFLNLKRIHNSWLCYNALFLQHTKFCKYSPLNFGIAMTNESARHEMDVKVKDNASEKIHLLTRAGLAIRRTGRCPDAPLKFNVGLMAPLGLVR